MVVSQLQLLSAGHRSLFTKLEPQRRPASSERRKPRTNLFHVLDKSRSTTKLSSANDTMEQRVVKDWCGVNKNTGVLDDSLLRI